jgi:hypothetical protein
MRTFIPLLLVSIVACSLQAAENWPPRAEDGIVADVYPSRELALRAIHAKLGDDAKIVEANGKIVATAKADASRELTVSVIDKPWAADWSSYANQTRGDVILGRSTTPCTSAAEAETAARQSVVAALMPLVRQRMTPGMGAAPNIPDDSIRGVIEANVRRNEMIRDRFVQRFSRPYGDVWYEAVLVDTSSPHIDAMVSQVNHLERRTVERQIGIIVAFLLLLAVTTFAYVVINWLTKGYFVWRLRLAAMTMLVIAAIAGVALA